MIVLFQSPNEETRSTLRSLFPTTQKFHPGSQEPPSKKRKMSLERRKRLTVCVLPASHSTIPRGSTRSLLQGERRIQEILFLRSWTELRVRQSIAEAFLGILDPDNPEDDILFMSSNAGAGISNAPDPSTFEGPSGDVGWTGTKVLALAGRGCLYVKSKKELQDVSFYSEIFKQRRAL